MNLVDLIENLESEGVELWVEEDCLRYRGARDVLTAEALQTLKRNKTDVLRLQRERARDHTLYPASHGQRALWFLP